MEKIPSTILAEMVEAIIARYPNADHSCYSWEESARIIFMGAETASELKDAVKIMRLASIWNEQEN